MKGLILAMVALRGYALWYPIGLTAMHGLAAIVAMCRYFYLRGRNDRKEGGLMLSYAFSNMVIAMCFSLFI